MSHGIRTTPVRLSENLEASALVQKLETFLRGAKFPTLGERAADLVKFLEAGGLASVTPQDTGAAIERAIQKRKQAREISVPAARAFLDERQASALDILLSLEITRLELHRQASR